MTRDEKILAAWKQYKAARWKYYWGDWEQINSNLNKMVFTGTLYLYVSDWPSSATP